MTLNITLNNPQNGQRQVDINTTISATISSDSPISLESINVSLSGLSLIEQGNPVTITNTFSTPPTVESNLITLDQTTKLTVGEYISICDAYSTILTNQIIAINNNAIKLASPIQLVYRSTQTQIISIISPTEIEVTNASYFDPSTLGFVPTVDIYNTNLNNKQQVRVVGKNNNILKLDSPIYLYDNIGSDGYYIDGYQIQPSSSNLDGYITLLPQIQSLSRSYRTIIQTNNDNTTLTVSLHPNTSLVPNKIYLVGMECQNKTGDYKRGLYSFSTQDTQPPQLINFKHNDKDSSLSFELIDVLGNQIQNLDVLINNIYAIKSNNISSSFDGYINSSNPSTQNVHIASKKQWLNNQLLNVVILTTDGYGNTNTIAQTFKTLIPNNQIQLTIISPAENSILSPLQNRFYIKFKVAQQIPLSNINVNMVQDGISIPLIKKGTLESSSFKNTTLQKIQSNSQECIIELEGLSLLQYNQKVQFDVFFQQVSNLGDYLETPYYTRSFHYVSTPTTGAPIIVELFPSNDQSVGLNTNIQCTILSLIDGDPIDIKSLFVTVNGEIAIQSGQITSNYTGTVETTQGTNGNQVVVNFKPINSFKANTTVRVSLSVSDQAGSLSTQTTSFNVFNNNAPILTFTPSGGYYNSITRITLSADQDAIIYYTLDGSVPQQGNIQTFSQISPVHDIPIYKNGTTLVRGYAVNASKVVGPLVNQVYNINTFKPVVNIISPIKDLTVSQRVVSMSYSIQLSNGYLTRVEYSVNGGVPIDVGNTLQNNSTLIVNLTSGVNIIQLIATDNSGNIGVSTTSVIVNPSSIESLQLNYAPLHCPVFSSRNVTSKVLLNENIDTTTLAIIGYGSRTEQLVSFGIGQGKDGTSVDFNLANSSDGRHFELVAFPVLDNSLKLTLLRKGKLLTLSTSEFAFNSTTGQLVLDHPIETGEQLIANYICETELNQPELFTPETLNNLYQKHGNPSLDNTLSLAARLAVENGATRILAIQPKPFDQDPNWINAFKALENQECYWIIPVVNIDQTNYYFQVRLQGLIHVEKMSQVKYRKERYLMSSRIGLEPNHLNSSRAALIEVDNQNSISTIIEGTNQNIHYSFIAAVVAARASSLLPVALPLTKKQLQGIQINSLEKSTNTTMDEKFAEGILTVQPTISGGVIYRGRSSYLGASPIYQEISIQRTSDYISKILRQTLEQQFVGRNITSQLHLDITNAVKQFLDKSLDIISSGSLVSYNIDNLEPRQLNLEVQYSPLYPLNQFSITISLSPKL